MGAAGEGALVARGAFTGAFATAGAGAVLCAWSVTGVLLGSVCWLAEWPVDGAGPPPEALVGAEVVGGACEAAGAVGGIVVVVVVEAGATVVAGAGAGAIDVGGDVDGTRVVVVGDGCTVVGGTYSVVVVVAGGRVVVVSKGGGGGGGKSEAENPAALVDVVAEASLSAGVVVEVVVEGVR